MHFWIQQERYLSKKGQGATDREVLSSIPTYYRSLMQAPMMVTTKLKGGLWRNITIPYGGGLWRNMMKGWEISMRIFTWGWAVATESVSETKMVGWSITKQLSSRHLFFFGDDREMGQPLGPETRLWISGILALLHLNTRLSSHGAGLEPVT